MKNTSADYSPNDFEGKFKLLKREHPSGRLFYESTVQKHFHGRQAANQVSMNRLSWEPRRYSLGTAYKYTIGQGT